MILYTYTRTRQSYASVYNGKVEESIFRISQLLAFSDFGQGESVQ